MRAGPESYDDGDATTSSSTAAAAASPRPTQQHAELDPALSADAADLVRQLVATAPPQRASAASLLSHPWLRESSSAAAQGRDGAEDESERAFEEVRPSPLPVCLLVDTCVSRLLLPYRAIAPACTVFYYRSIATD